MSRHIIPSKGSVLPTRLRVLFFVVAAFALGNVVNTFLPDIESIIIQPFTRVTHLSQPVQMRSGTVTIIHPQLAKQVKYRNTTIDTDNIFLVATVHLDSSGETGGVNKIELVGGNGKIYGGTQLAGMRPECTGTQPGIPLTCTIAIETTLEAAPGAKLRLHNYDSLLGDEAPEVDLGITTDMLSKADSLTLIPQVGQRTFGIIQQDKGGENVK